MLGSAFVVDVFGGGSGLDALGVLAAVCGAVTLVIYLVSSERAGQRYDAFTTLLWGFGFATAVLGRGRAGLDVPVRAALELPQHRAWGSACR